MSAVRVQAERGLQEEIMWRLKPYPILAVPIPNGIWIPARSESEKSLVARLIARLKADGMLLPGAPDLLLAWAGGCGFVELKRPAHRDIFGHHPAGTPSDAQKEFARRCRVLGINHAFCRTWEGLRERLGEWGALK